MATTNRCVVVLGESAAAAEAVVKAVMDKVSKGELRRQHQHERLRNAQFVPFSAASFRRMAREEVDARAGDLRALVRDCCAAGRGVVLVLQDLGYAAEAWAAAASWKRSGLDYYCPVEHAVMELGSLVRRAGAGAGGRDEGTFWLLGFAASASYASCCRSGHPSLETVLGLHPVVVPDDGGLALSLAGDSEVTHCNCGADTVMAATAAAASVPSWMHHRCQQGRPVVTGSELTLSFSHHDSNKSCEPWRHDLMDDDGRRQRPLLNRGHDDGPMMMAGPHDQISSLANPNNSGSSNSVSKSNSSDGTTTTTPDRRRRRRPKFTELTAENLKVLCSALETRVPRHRDIAPRIASAVLRRRSGVARTTTRRRPTPATWLLFHGRDSDGKTAMARELARLVFGSDAEFTCITPDPDRSGGSSSSPGCGGDHHGLKRQRSSPEKKAHGGSSSRMQMFYEAIRENPHRVVLIDGGGDSEQLDAGVMDAMASGTVRGCDGGVVSLEDSIVVCCRQVLESMSSSSPRVSSAPRPVKQRIITSDVDGSSKVEDDDGAEKGVVGVPRFSLDLNACAAIDGEGEEGRSSSYNAMEILNAVDGVFFF